MAEELTEEEVKTLQGKKEAGEELTTEEESALTLATTEPPEKTPEGEEEKPGEGEPTETPEEMVTRLEAEKEDLQKEKDRLGFETRTLRDSMKNIPAATPAPVSKSIFDGRSDEEGVTIAEAKGAQKENLGILLGEIDQLRATLSEGMARVKYKDYDEVVAKFDELAAANPALNRIAFFDANPAEFKYQRGLTHPDILKKRGSSATDKVITKLKTPKPKIPKRGSGGGAGALSLEAAAELSPDEIAALSPKEKARLLKESGGG